MLSSMMFLAFMNDFIKDIGSPTFIRALLTMAGVESNPGPTDKLIFRYQYLLMEIGTEVLRKLFDKLVGNDFMQYLNTNKSQYRQLLFLINKDIITDEQKQVLPTIDMQPTSANFDITLLACLLRNVCGLRSQKDPVWKSPAPCDISVEADITRLRESRNHLLHSRTVLISETVFTDKWNDLCLVLTRLSTVVGMTNISTLINVAESMDLDDELKKRYDESLNAWDKAEQLFDRGIEGLKLGQSELKDGQSEIQHDLSKLGDSQSQLQTNLSLMKTNMVKLERGQRDQGKLMQAIRKNQTTSKRHLESIENSLREQKRCKTDTDADLREIVKKSYLKYCSKIKLFPLCGEDEDMIEMLTIYQPPELFHLPYHRNRQQEGNYPISSFKEIFCKVDNCFKNIYITGDAGVGKTTFCQHMCLLWCKSISGEKSGNNVLQRDIDFMAKFDFVFCISLTDNVHEDMTDMIIDNFFYTRSSDNREEMIKSIESVLQQKNCLVIFDGLDEWKPTGNAIRGRKCPLPRGISSEKCTYLTTCRPYKLEQARLSSNDVDHQVQMTGINEQSAVCYVTEIVNRVNHVDRNTRNIDDFLKEVSDCELTDLIRIPMIASQIVMLWYRQTLTNMSRALIYGYIVDMLFERAEMKAKIELPVTSVSRVKLLDSFSELPYLNRYVSLLEKVCTLSFRSLLQQSDTDLVFTTHQLMSKPFNISSEEMQFLCKIGILSKNKVIGHFGKQEHKLSFLHKSYLEFLAAMYVTVFDCNNMFDSVMKTWTTVDNVVQYESFFLLLAGFVCHKFDHILQTVFRTISDDLGTCRRNSIFHYDCDFYRNPFRSQLESLQNIVLNCYNEILKSHDTSLFLKLEDFTIVDDSSFDILEGLLLVNTSCLKSINSVQGKYYRSFDRIDCLQCLNIGQVVSTDFEKFTNCMLRNKSTLNTLCVNGCYQPPTIPELPMRSLRHLTALSLSDIQMSHKGLHDMVKFLSDNVCFENIKLYDVSCHEHRNDHSDCVFTLNLLNHSKLLTLCLWGVDILCNMVNDNCLQYLTLWPLSKYAASGYIGILDCLGHSQLEHLYISDHGVLDHQTTKASIATLKTLPRLKSLTLWEMNLENDTLLQLHPGVKQMQIGFRHVIMSLKCFNSFIENIVRNESMLKVELRDTKLTSFDGETLRELSVKESVEYMNRFLNKIPTVNIVHKLDNMLQVLNTACICFLRNVMIINELKAQINVNETKRKYCFFIIISNILHVDGSRDGVN